MEVHAVGSLSGKTWIAGVLLILMVATIFFWQRSRGDISRSGQIYPVSHTDQEWRQQLPAPVYQVLRKASTEPSNSSPLNHEHRQGTFVCAGCQAPLFDSEDKFDSGTGWPSFVRPASDGRVATRIDYKIGFPRTEVFCSDCGGHLGHVFSDGPAPTGKRYCMNGLALEFVTQQKAKQSGVAPTGPP